MAKTYEIIIEEAKICAAGTFSAAAQGRKCVDLCKLLIRGDDYPIGDDAYAAHLGVKKVIDAFPVEDRYLYLDYQLELREIANQLYNRANPK